MLASAYDLRDSTKVSFDPFSHVLKFTRAEAVVTGGLIAGGSWAIRFLSALI
jgi:hypothetical protein